MSERYRIRSVVRVPELDNPSALDTPTDSTDRRAPTDSTDRHSAPAVRIWTWWKDLGRHGEAILTLSRAGGDSGAGVAPCRGFAAEFTGVTRWRRRLAMSHVDGLASAAPLDEEVESVLLVAEPGDPLPGESGTRVLGRPVTDFCLVICRHVGS